MEEQFKAICGKCRCEFEVLPARVRFAAEKNFFCLPLYCDDCFAKILEKVWEVPGEKRLVACSDCGRETKLHFVPTQEKPVFCGDCYKKRLDRNRSE